MNDNNSLQTIANNFTNELTLSQKGKKTSLAYIKNTIPSSPIVKKGEIFQAMSIGGTNFKSAVIRKGTKALEILNLDEKAQPPVFETREDFLNFIEENLADDINILAINFAFPLKPVFSVLLEGIFLYPTKEHKFEGLVGKNICTEIENYIKEKNRKTIKVSAANDTICLLLSGKIQISGDNIAAGIVGTGLNFGFFENSTTLINTESGGFDKFPLSPTGKIIDETSIGKGLYLFEKEIAGAYLYEHFNILAKERKYFIPDLKNSKELTDLAAREDGSQACLLAKALLRHSALLASCAIAGITKYKKQDMYFVMVGSLFWKGEGYKTIIREIVGHLVPEYKVHFLGIENSDLLGAAKLVA